MILDGQMKDMYCHDLNTFSKITVESLIQRPWKVNHHRKHIVHEGTMYVDEMGVKESVYSWHLLAPEEFTTQGPVFEKVREITKQRLFCCPDIVLYSLYFSMRNES